MQPPWFDPTRPVDGHGTCPILPPPPPGGAGHPVAHTHNTYTPGRRRVYLYINAGRGGAGGGDGDTQPGLVVVSVGQGRLNAAPPPPQLATVLHRLPTDDQKALH